MEGMLAHWASGVGANRIGEVAVSGRCSWLRASVASRRSREGEADKGGGTASSPEFDDSRFHVAISQHCDG